MTPNTPRSPIITAPIVLVSILPAAPVKGARDVFAGGLWPDGSTPVAKVVPPVTPAGPGGAMAVGTAGAGAGLPAASTTLGDSVAPPVGFWVVNCTWGTVTSVERSEMVDDDGIGWPAETPAE